MADSYLLTEAHERLQTLWQSTDNYTEDGPVLCRLLGDVLGVLGRLEREIEALKTADDLPPTATPGAPGGAAREA